MIGIIDYHMGNLASVKNGFAKIGAEAEVVSDPEGLASYERVILPGVGAFPDAMAHLRDSGMQEAVLAFAQSGRPLLGICLGMQLLFEKSHEFGENPGLGLIPGEVVRFDESQMNTPHKIPQMGWNLLNVVRETPLFVGLPKSFYLYFVHSFHALPKETEDTIGETEYGYRFCSAVQRENIFGFQPHPEKSHEMGLKILKNFVEL